MCGIAGFWNAKQSCPSPVEVLSRMGRALVHRGPDDEGVWWDAGAGLGLAFRRLAILDLSVEGHQPMFSASGRLGMVFNGEVYNYEEVRAELGERKWRGHSDTEVMLEALERWGVEGAVRRFVGMFAFALWDREERKLHLVRDRLGIKPLYYGRAGSVFLFASELKAIRQHPEFVADIDRDALALYMRHNYVPSPHCIYKGLHKLRPGCVLTLGAQGADPEVRRYWSAEEVARRGRAELLRASDAEAVEESERLLKEAVRLRMIADVPLGAFLSGGVDSSAVVALMQAQSTKPVKTFTIGFHEQGYNEAADARRVAEHLRTEHTELYLGAREAQDVVPLLPEMFDEPFADSSQIPTFLVSRLARGSVTVSLSGDGGDELFGGYNRYQLTRNVWKSLELLPRFARDFAIAILQAIPHLGLDPVIRLLRPFAPRLLRQGVAGDKALKLARLLSLDGPEAFYYDLLSHWKDPADLVRGAREPVTVREDLTRVFRDMRIADAMMLVDLLNYLPDDILTKVDRASMAVGLEARLPLLDHRLVEFAWSLPSHLKVRGSDTKWILRQVLYRHVPAKLVERPKMGFAVPIDRWLRGELRDWAEDLLSARSLADHGLFKIDQIREKWCEHIAGTRNWHYLLWDVLVFQDWFVKNRASKCVPEQLCTSEVGFSKFASN